MRVALGKRNVVGNASLAVAFITLLAIGTDLFVVSPLLPTIAQQYRVVPGVAGNAVTLFSLAYMLGAPCMGLLADRVGRHTMLFAGLLGFAAANILTGLAPWFIFFLVMRVAAGCAAAAVTPNVLALVGQLAPEERRGRWMSITVAGFLLSLVIGAPIGTVVASLLSWRVTFAGIGLVTLLLAGINRLAWSSEVQSVHSQVRIGASEPFHLGHTLRAVTVTGLWAFTVYSVYTYLGTGLRAHGFSTGSIAAALILYGIGAVVGSLGSGHLIDRYGASRIVLLSFVLLAAALLGLDLVWPLSPFLVLFTLGLFALTAYPCFAAFQSRLVGKFPRHTGSVFAWNSCFLYLGTSLGAGVGGALLSTRGFQLILLVAACISLVAALYYRYRAFPHAAP